MIGELVLVYMTNMNMGRKDVNKLISRPLWINKWSGNLFVYILIALIDQF